MSETILTAENLKFRYDSEQPGYALNGVSMQVKRGEFVAVLGANGCGKSTLAKHFNAILLPEEGKVYVEGMDTADDDKLYDIRQTVGMGMPALTSSSRSSAACGTSRRRERTFSVWLNTSFGVPSITTLPWLITRTRSACAASSM